jgi:hypothetical protein
MGRAMFVVLARIVTFLSGDDDVGALMLLYEGWRIFVEIICITGRDIAVDIPLDQLPD